ncbi:hypothetical protein F511_07007 [Dorcoceras hygrometricum]|uniref:Uncharacterized protein n=1 Tax=Dorcoceras hygrometricum TaxID=472368 RepID=A0A2Z7CZD2_9LAMI|nr:hypothetical protein F511_07007 [Dorcoceras hygrometricum]
MSSFLLVTYKRRKFFLQNPSILKLGRMLGNERKVKHNRVFTMGLSGNYGRFTRIV